MSGENLVAPTILKTDDVVSSYRLSRAVDGALRTVRSLYTEATECVVHNSDHAGHHAAMNGVLADIGCDHSGSYSRQPSSINHRANPPAV